MEVLPILGCQRAELRHGMIRQERPIGMCLIQPVLLNPRDQRPVRLVQPHLRRLAR